MSNTAAPDASGVHKVRTPRGRRFLRLLGSTLDPRAWAHFIKVMNFYNYSHVSELRKARLAPGVNISPTASFANGQNVDLGRNVTISAYCQLWAGPGHARIVIGDDGLIAPDVMMTATNYRYNDGAPIEDQAMDEADILIGSDVWIGRGATILPGTEIGDGSIISAGAVVRGHIPARAIVSGNPGRVIGARRLPGEAGPETGTLLEAPDAVVAALLAKAVPDADDARLAMPLADCGVDSFDLITLRTGIEAETGATIPDAQWAGLTCLADIPRLPVFGNAAATTVAPAAPAPVISAPAQIETLSTGPGHAARRFALNMPQMALSGLSEPWLFKELGDIHWHMITGFLGSASAKISDDAGDRLYATFTRILLEVDPSLRAFRENADVAIDSHLSRYGASFFTGKHRVSAEGAGVTAHTMSTFAKYGERGKNTSLVKGSPTLPNPDAIPSQAEFPQFGVEYRARRSAEREGQLFACDYEILPPHDINGVGLLYFAAYPTIFDLCIEKFEGKGFLMGHSTVSKDICYFANSEPQDTLSFRLHSREEEAGLIRHTASLYRKGDGVRMAEVISEKCPL